MVSVRLERGFSQRGPVNPHNEKRAIEIVKNIRSSFHNGLGIFNGSRRYLIKSLSDFTLNLGKGFLV